MLPFPLAGSTATRYQLNVVKNATNQFPSRGALPFPAARPARSAMVLSNLRISKGGCDVAYMQTLRPYVLE